MKRCSIVVEWLRAMGKGSEKEREGRGVENSATSLISCYVC